MLNEMANKLKMVTLKNNGIKEKNTQLTKSERLFLERFKSAADRRKNIVVTSQKQIAHEICLNSRTGIGFNQSMVSLKSCFLNK